MSVLLRATAIQGRVIGALMLRDLVAQGASGTIPFFKVLRRPIFMVAAFYVLGRVASGLAPHGIPLLVFIVTGYLTWLAFLRSFVGVSGAGGSARVLMIPHVTPLDLMLSVVALEFFVYTAIFVALTGAGLLFEQAPLPADPLGVILAFWSAIGLGTAMGMIAASVGRITPILTDLFMGVRILGHALSGVFALATDTPLFVLEILKWNPLFHSIEWLRESWWSGYKSPIADPMYILTCLFFLVAIGLATERVTRPWMAE